MPLTDADIMQYVSAGPVPVDDASDEDAECLCECEMPGPYYCGVPGILALVHDGKVAADFKVERCDQCDRYETDAAARQKLVDLGMIE